MDNSDHQGSINSLGSGYNPEFFQPTRLSESVVRLLDQLDVDPKVLDDIKSEFRQSPNASKSGANYASFSEELSDSMPSLADQLKDAMPSSGNGLYGESEGYFA